MLNIYTVIGFGIPSNTLVNVLEARVDVLSLTTMLKLHVSQAQATAAHCCLLG